MPVRSHTTTSFTPSAWRILTIATPAAPAPDITTRMSESFLPTTRSALVSAASTTMAVPCWSSWKTGMSSTARRRDVLEVDAAIGGGDQLDRSDDLVGVLRRQRDRPGVHARELLEEHRLALHHRHGRGRPDVAEAQHRRPVGHHRHGVALDGELAGVVGVGGDGAAHAGDPWRVGHRQVVAGAQRDLRGDLELAAQVEEEGPVADLVGLYTFQAVDGLGDLLGVVGVTVVAGQVHDQSVSA